MGAEANTKEKASNCIDTVLVDALTNGKACLKRELVLTEQHVSLLERLIESGKQLQEALQKIDDLEETVRRLRKTLSICGHDDEGNTEPSVQNDDEFAGPAPNSEG